MASETIDWEKIKTPYRDVVRHMAALKTGTVTPEVMMKRLSADNKMHPVYQALLEIGKASRTIFLCRYLSSEELRIEIHDALNVVERVNGKRVFKEVPANYVFYYDDPRGQFRTIYGTPVTRFSSRNSKEYHKELRINSGKHLSNTDHLLYTIKDGIVVVKKGAVLPDGFVI